MEGYSATADGLTQFHQNRGHLEDFLANCGDGK